MNILKKITAVLLSLIMLYSVCLFTAVNDGPVIENAYYKKPTKSGTESVDTVAEPNASYRTAESDGEHIEPTVKAFGKSTPSIGNAKMLAIYVDFADAKYKSDAYTPKQIENELFGTGNTAYPYDSVTAWFERASYGNFHVDGDVFTYTCSGNLSDYMSDGDRVFEDMVMEVLTGLDKDINYNDYDENKDGVIDCIMFTVPLDGADQATLDYWYGCTATWYDNPGFRVDGMELKQYIIMDVMPYADDMTYLKQTAIHEMGHSMGLPDYYLYNSGANWENLKGAAGYERMDDSIGDFCSFSKLMYGWLMDTEVQSYDGTGAQTFMLDDASTKGSCLILPISSSAEDYTSEYFLVEYITKSGNNSDIYTRDQGVRVFHVQAELYTSLWWNYTNFKYEGFSELYRGDDKIRVIRLVNNGRGFYHSGDSISFGTSNFAAYDSNGDQTIDTGYTISIGELKDGKYSITVDRTRKLLPGDVNDNGIMDAGDATLILRAVVGKYELTREQLSAADMNENSKIDSADATIILRAVVGAV